MSRTPRPSQTNPCFLYSEMAASLVENAKSPSFYLLGSVRPVHQGPHQRVGDSQTSARTMNPDGVHIGEVGRSPVRTPLGPSRPNDTRFVASHQIHGARVAVESIYLLRFARSCELFFVPLSQGPRALRRHLPAERNQILCILLACRSNHGSSTIP